MSDPTASAEPVGEEFVAEPVILETEVAVKLQRSVRVGPVIIGAAFAGVLIAAVMTLFFPVAEDAVYALGQIVGFMALIGGAIGLGVGTVLALILGSIAKRRTGTGVAIQRGVQ